MDEQTGNQTLSNQIEYKINEDNCNETQTLKHKQDSETNNKDDITTNNTEMYENAHSKDKTLTKHKDQTETLSNDKETIITKFGNQLGNNLEEIGNYIEKGAIKFKDGSKETGERIINGVKVGFNEGIDGIKEGIDGIKEG